MAMVAIDYDIRREVWTRAFGPHYAESFAASMARYAARRDAQAMAYLSQRPCNAFLHAFLTMSVAECEAAGVL